MRFSLLVVVSLSWLGCPAPSKPPVGTPPEAFCPGAAGCEGGADGTFRAGIAAVSIAPTGWERPRPEYLEDQGSGCPEGSPVDRTGTPRCGALSSRAFKDCGADAVCPDDPGYAGPDADGTEKDGVPDWFLDCGRDHLCAGDVGYAGPDADGSEGDGAFQGFTLAGFGNNVIMDGVHDEAQARAVVFENGDVSVAMVVLDVVGLFRDDVLKVRDRVKKALADGGPDYVLVSSTHTHEGPDTMGQWGLREGLLPVRGVDDAWLKDVVVAGAAQAVVDAYRSRRPARLFVAQARLGPVSNEVLVDHRDPFITDDTVTVLKLTEASSGLPIGTVVSWGDHPETLSDTNNLASADFAWALRESMENGVKTSSGQLLAMGAGGTSVFVNGAVGGMMSSLHANPTSVDGQPTAPRSYAKTRAVGEKVALVALGALGEATELPAPPVAYGAQTLKIKVENEAFQLIFESLDLVRRRLYDYQPGTPLSDTNYPHVMTEVAKVQVGGLRFLAVPGELLPELAVGYDATWSIGNPVVKASNPNPPDMSLAPGPPYLKQQLAGEWGCVVGLANDELGYLIPPFAYVLDAEQPYFSQAPGDHYEETNSLGPSTTPTLLGAYQALLSWEPLP